MRCPRIVALAWMAAVSACLSLGALSAQADEYEGFASLDGAPMPLSLQLSGGSFSATIYEDKGKACPGENAPFAALRQAVLGAATGWVRISYKDCKENFALVCVDPDLAAKGPLPTCTAITTETPPQPDIIESFAGNVTYSADDDGQPPTISFSGAVFTITVTPDSKNVCKGKDNFAAARRVLKLVQDDQSIRITFKSCTPDQALVCIDTALTGAFKPKACASVGIMDDGDSGNN
jgi:hypothetical protein